MDTTTESGVGKTIAGLRASFDRDHTRPLSWRLSQLDAMLNILEAGEERLLAALAEDLGKPRLEGWAADLGATAAEIRYIRKHLPKWVEPKRVRLPLNAMPGRGRIHPEPLGVVLVIAPWNYPVQLLLEPMAAAIAAGNAVVAKPSELAPATSAALADLITTHLDGEAIAVVEGGPEVSQALIEERFDHVFFTGSTRVGQIVAEAAAKHLTPVTLELGGKSPTIVDSSADIEIAARRIAWGKWLNAGQTCIAPDYVLVDHSVRDALVTELEEAANEFYGPDPSRSPDYGRIVSDAHFDRLQGLLADTQILMGGRSEPGQRYLSPTVVADPAPDTPIMQEEIFGPILPVIGVESLEESIRFVRERPTPLALYVFADDKQAVDTVLDRTRSGGACVNHTLFHVAVPTLPFGGIGPSGTGRYHGRSGFDAFSNLKSVLHKPVRPDIKLAYPPFTALKEKVIRKAL